MTILDQIACERREAVKQAKAHMPLERLAAQASARVHHSLAENLREFAGKCVIAEVKKASPSAGVIKEEFEPESIACSYIEWGAKGISVLTEPNHFMGSFADLIAVRQITDLPVLRKDFIVDSYQVTETAAWGADVMLLIVAMIDPLLLRDLYEEGREYGLDILVESHNQDELEIAMDLPEAILGINNRNLKTFEVSLDTSRQLAAQIPAERLSISESGIASQSEIHELANLGYRGFLIGESLLRGNFSF